MNSLKDDINSNLVKFWNDNRGLIYSILGEEEYLEIPLKRCPESTERYAHHFYVRFFADERNCYRLLEDDDPSTGILLYENEVLSPNTEMAAFISDEEQNDLYGMTLRLSSGEKCRKDQLMPFVKKRNK